VALEAGRRLFTKPCVFTTAAAVASDLPAPGVTEVAFAGRSNVGKSSLLNALIGQRALARTSRNPGRTQQINFFLLGERLYLVDMPGWGYARAPKAAIARWSDLVEAYLKRRPTLRRAYLLIDVRHGPKDSDRAVMSLLDEAAVSYQIVFTKADKTAVTEIAGRIAEVQRELAGRAAAHPAVLTTSARKGSGIGELRGQLATLVEAG